MEKYQTIGQVTLTALLPLALLIKVRIQQLSGTQRSVANARQSAKRQSFLSSSSLHQTKSLSCQRLFEGFVA
jgi:hypothetical protein